MASPDAVTVVVPFRNEMQHLPALAADMARQQWQAGRVEVLFVNDHSEDGSEEWLRSFVRGRNNWSVVDLAGNRRGKKEALAEGVARASHDWIIQTDADCRLSPLFIAAHMETRKETGAALVAGPVTTWERGNGFLEKLERLDLLSLTGIAAGTFFRGRPLLCSGANLSYSRQLYMETRTFDPSGRIASGDDLFLMIGARRLNRPMAFMTAPGSVVHTAPTRDLATLLRQRIRWGAKTRDPGAREIQAVALLAVLVHFILLATPWLSLAFPAVWGWMWLGFAGKTAADFLLLCRTAGYTGQRRDLRMFLPVLLLYYPYMGLAMAGSLFFRGTWKK